MARYRNKYVRRRQRQNDSIPTPPSSPPASGIRPGQQTPQPDPNEPYYRRRRVQQELPS